MSPMRRELYGNGWEEFSRRIRFERAEGRCECAGECGSASCEAERAAFDPSKEHPGRCSRKHGEPIHDHDGSVVVLTTAHLCHEHGCRDETHVLALCQRCHLNLDRAHHARNASRTRDAKAGQGRMFDA
jgi:hypothetical protein